MRFARRLIKDPEVAVVRDMARLEGSSELLGTALRDYRKTVRDEGASSEVRNESQAQLEMAVQASLQALQCIAHPQLGSMESRSLVAPSPTKSASKTGINGNLPSLP